MWSKNVGKSSHSLSLDKGFQETRRMPLPYPQYLELQILENYILDLPT